MTLTYTTASGYPYHIETATNLFPAIWTTVAGSTTNATVSVVTFTDPNALGSSQRFYRVVSP